MLLDSGKLNPWLFGGCLKISIKRPLGIPAIYDINQSFSQNCFRPNAVLIFGHKSSHSEDAFVARILPYYRLRELYIHSFHSIYKSSVRLWSILHFPGRWLCLNFKYTYMFIFHNYNSFSHSLLISASSSYWSDVSTIMYCFILWSFVFSD